MPPAASRATVSAPTRCRSRSRPRAASRSCRRSLAYGIASLCDSSCHADRRAACAVRDSGTGDVAKAQALVEAVGGIFGPHAETKAKPAASGLVDQRAHQLLANALAARIRFHADRHLRSLFVSIGNPEFFGRKAPRPGCTDDFAVLFGDEPEIPRSLPADEIFGYRRNCLRRLCIRFISRHRQKIPQYLEVILHSWTDHKIGHQTCSLARQLRPSYCVSCRSNPWRCIPTATWPMPGQESSQERRAWSARSYERMEHPANPTAAQRSRLRWSSTGYW